MKVALVAFGNEESYGLLFVGGELLLHHQEIKFFDAEEINVVERIKSWNPDFVFFSPLITFVVLAKNIAVILKKDMPKIVTVFGGHHISSCCDAISKTEGIDVLVSGPAKGSIEQILSGKKGLIKTSPKNINDLPLPARKEYYRDIPRMRNRYRKVMTAIFGCPWNCSYCSSASGHIRELFGDEAHKNYFLKRRKVSNIIEEAQEILSLGPTEEIEWVDDDIFSGLGVEKWLSEFIPLWKKKINLPMYVSSTSKSILKVDGSLLKKLKKIVNCIGLGIQAIRPESLKIFNRAWDNEKLMKSAYERCISFGFRVNLQAIVGLSVEDPVEEALDTVKALQRIGLGSICSVYPLQIYPGTEMEKFCLEHNFRLNPESTGDTNAGIPGIYFEPEVVKKLRNICKLATFFVKYGIDERLMRILIDINFSEDISKALSWARYRECIIDRLKSRGEEIFEDIYKSTKLRY